MKVSLITATYNSAKTIADTLRSVQQQTYPHIEHIIVDGLSTDETLNIVQTFPHIHEVVSEKDKGIYDAMNKGIELASGEVIGIINSDDFYIHASVIEKIIAVFNDENCDAVYADLIYVDTHDVNKIKRKWVSGKVKSNSFLYGWMPPHPTFFVRKSVYENFGKFNLNLGSAADYELMLRFIHKHKIKIGYLPEVILKMRTGGISNQSVQNRVSANQNDRLAWKVNNMKPYWFTLYLKPLRKVSQFFIH
ncbi:MAG: glycosyltransferase [Sphingobacteriia bacterium]|nr:glycosyltransferase [Sphingobacteriia bacterium]